MRKRSMLNVFPLYLKLISASIRSRMQYKFDFLASSVVQALMGLYDFLFTVIIVLRFKSIGGWDVYEVALLFALSRMGFGLYRMFCNEVDNFERYIVTGEFDSVLVRPWPSLFILVTKNFDLSRFPWFLQGAGVAAFALPVLLSRGSLNTIGLLHLVGCTVWSFLLFVAVGVATAAAAFWIVRIDELSVFTINASSTSTLYPMHIFPSWFRLLFMLIIPVGLGNYLPAVYLLGKGGSWLNLAIPPAATAVFLVTAKCLWHLGERRYHSTGS